MGTGQSASDLAALSLESSPGKDKARQCNGTRVGGAARCVADPRRKPPRARVRGALVQAGKDSCWNYRGNRFSRWVLFVASADPVFSEPGVRKSNTMYLKKCDHGPNGELPAQEH